MIEPNGFNSWNPAMRGAYRKGYKAGIEGASKSACPYEDKRKADGRLTWSRAFAAAWCDGWTAGDANRKSDIIDAFYTDRNNSGNAALSK